MASKVIPMFLRYIKFASGVRTNLNSRTSKLLLSSTVQQRTFATEENKEKGEPELSESEKKFSAEIDSLTKEISTLKEKNNELLDKYKRALADSENLRQRLTKQIEDAKIFGIQGFCKDLLEVADILGHATKSVPSAEISDKNPHLKNLYEGLCMTQATLQQVFKRHGLEVIDPVNQKFDPNLHEALFQKEVEGAASNIVVEVSKIGYKLRERCIRPALVGVSKT